MALRLVLDTNVVLDIFHWRDPGAMPILAAARAGDLSLMANARCLSELQHVLLRPHFGLKDGAAEEIVGRYLALALQHEGEAAHEPIAALPRCRDEADQKFLELARDAVADLLVTRDKALLRLARRKFGLHRFRIVRPEEAVALIGKTLARR